MSEIAFRWSGILLVDLRSYSGFCRPGFPGPGASWVCIAPHRSFARLDWLGNHPLAPGLAGGAADRQAERLVLPLAALCGAAPDRERAAVKRVGSDNLNFNCNTDGINRVKSCNHHYFRSCPSSSTSLHSSGWWAWFPHCTTLSLTGPCQL